MNTARSAVPYKETKPGWLLLHLLLHLLSTMLYELLEILLVEVKEELLVDVLEMRGKSGAGPSWFRLGPRKVDKPKLSADHGPQILLVDLEDAMSISV